MEFHSEWLLDDPMEVLTDLNKEVYTKDEIEKLSTKENLSEIEKACTLLDHGQISQKLWVVRNLHNIMHENRFHEIIVELINRLPYWNESSQEEAGKALTKVLSNGCFPNNYNEHLLNLSFQIVDSETWSLQKTWAEVISVLAHSLSEKLVLRCTIEAMNLSDFSQKDETRAVGGIILGAIVDATKKPTADVTRKICSMAQDPSNFVRLNMCQPLRNLFKLPEYETKAVEEIIKLVGDECIEVLEESLQLFVDILHNISDKVHALGNIEEYFSKSRYDKLTSIKLRYVGRIMKELKTIMSIVDKEKWLDWVLDMAREGGINEKQSLSVSFGGILECCLIGNKALQIWRILEEQDDDIIRSNLVVQVGFMATFGRERVQAMQVIVRKYAKSDEYLLQIVPQFTVISACLMMQEELLQILIEKIAMQLNVRAVLAVLDQMLSFAIEFSCIGTLKSTVPALIQLGKTAALPVVHKSLELLSVIIYKIPGHSCKLQLANEIITNFANSISCYHRASYIHFCLFIKALCSKSFFCRHFMQSLLPLSKDPTNSVRYLFAKNYVTFRYLVPQSNTDLLGNFRSILNYYLELDDKILINYSIAADKNLNNSALWEASYGQASEVVEAQRMKAEEDEETKEIAEKENLKKVQIEENIRGLRKNNKKYLTVHKDVVPRQSSVKPIKKYNLSESDRFESTLNRTFLRTHKKK